jgi:hypothetical protein
MVERFALTRRSPLRRLTLWEREMDRFLGHRARWFDWPAYTWLAVPAGIDGSKISATYEGGVLELMLPAGETQEHKVEVTAKAAKAPKAKGTRTKKAKAKKE